MIDRRHMIIGGVAAGLVGDPAPARDRYDAVVAPNARRDVPAGRRFADLGAALAAVPRAGGHRIWLADGEWRGQHVIDTPDVVLIGEDRKRTRIDFTAAAGMIAPDGKHYGTYRTATLTASAQGGDVGCSSTTAARSSNADSSASWSGWPRCLPS